MTRLVAALALGSVSLVAFAAPPLTEVNVRDVDNPDRSSFRARLCQAGTSLTICDGPPATPREFTAPADKHVVIDVFSGECSAVNGASFRSLRATLLTDTSGFSALHDFYPQNALVGTSHTIYTWHFQTRLHVPAGATIRMTGNSLPFDGPSLAYCLFNVSGYMVSP